jgi:hypothetical protein
MTREEKHNRAWRGAVRAVMIAAMNLPAASTHRHEPRHLRMDALRAVIGIAATAGIMVIAVNGGFIWWLAFLALAVFVLFAGDVALRAATVVRADEAGVTVSQTVLGTARHVPWRGLTRLRLRNYATRFQKREGRLGLLELSLWDASGRRIGFGPTLEDFDVLAARAARHARAVGAEIDDASLEVLRAMGLE